MLLTIGPRSRSMSRIAAASVVSAAPVARPCTARAAISTAADPPVTKSAIAAAFKIRAAKATGRRPT